jgi:hypothetical protein
VLGKTGRKGEGKGRKEENELKENRIKIKRLKKVGKRERG